MRRSAARPWWLTAALGLLVVVAWWLLPLGGDTPDRPGSDRTDPHSGLRWIAVSELPEQAHEVLDRIDRGGPFDYPEDGSVFGNFEQILPREPRGYYREYTVETPGLRHRGPRRIVRGDAGEFYWTEDHYESFERISR